MKKKGGVLSALQHLKAFNRAHIGKSLQADLIATIVLSSLMLMKSLMGIMPELDLPMMIAGMMGTENRPLLGWAVQAKTINAGHRMRSDRQQPYCCVGSLG